MKTNPLNIKEDVPVSKTLVAQNIFLPIISKPLIGYVVAPNGSDENPGTYLLPWRTIEKAAQMVRPGETVYIREGIYAESVSFDISGTAANPIKIQAYPGENPAIDGGFSGGYGALLEIRGDYNYIDGIEVRNSKGRGIEVFGNYDVVDNVFVHHSIKAGIIISYGQHSTVQNSRVWRNSLTNEYGQGNAWASGLSAARHGVAYTTIRHNTVWENWGEGISAYEADHVTIEDNVVKDSLTGNIYISDATNVLCQRNFVYTDPNSYIYPYSAHVGIMMGDELSNPPSANITIINNISFGNRWNYALFRGNSTMNNILITNNTFVNGIITGGVILRRDHQNVRFENNIIQQDGPLPLIIIDDNPDMSFLNNLWSKLPIEAASGPGDVIGDPLLAKVGDPYASQWFRLTSLSPAIDKAVKIPEVLVDYFNKSRGNYPDMGAIEFLPE